MNARIDYYDRRGHAITKDEWLELSGSGDDRRVAHTIYGDVSVSTVWMGLNHQWGDGPPLIFETLVTGGEFDGDIYRYSTEQDARDGHTSVVADVFRESGT